MAPKSPRKGAKSPKTPKPQPKNDTISSSPSPKKSPRSRQLSDVTRRCRDCCAVWHEVINKWENLNGLGTSVANKLVNLQLQKQYTDKDDSTNVTVLSDLSEGAASHLEEEIVKTSQELSNIHQSLVSLHNKMKTLLTSFQAIRDLRRLRDGGEDSGYQDEPIFQTWTAHEYCVVSEKLLSMYGKELVLKEKLIPEFIRTEDRETLMLYISLWLHEPYLEDSHKLLLESMLIEAELK